MLQRGVLRGGVIRPNLFNEATGAEYIPLVAAQHDLGHALEMRPLDDRAPRAWITQHLIHGPIRSEVLNRSAPLGTDRAGTFEGPLISARRKIMNAVRFEVGGHSLDVP